MLDAFATTLEAKNPATDCFRSYRVEAGTDLFGTWMVEVTFGRIGSRGRTLQYTTTEEDAAKNLVRTILMQRASARRRIGVAYQCLEWNDPAKWIATPGFPSPPDTDGSGIAAHRRTSLTLPGPAWYSNQKEIK